MCGTRSLLISGLPEGWASCRVGDVVQVTYGKGLKKTNRTGGSVPVYGSNGIVGWHDVALTNGQTIILGRKGTVGAVNFSPLACWPIDTTYYIDDFAGFDVNYQVHALSILGLPELDTSSAIPGLNRDDVYSQEILVAPLAEQKRIVAKVEELLARVNAARERLAHVPAILKRFRQSVLAAACSGRLTADWREEQLQSRGLSESVAELTVENSKVNSDELPETWRIGSVAEVCYAVVDCPHSTPKWTDDGAICLRTTNFQVGRLDLSSLRYVSPETYQQRIRRLEPAAGDVLYSREGGILGIACMMPNGLRACLGQRMMLMRPKKWMLPHFVMHVLNSPATNQIVRDLTGGTASPHLNVGDVKQFTFPVPPFEEQQEIVRRVEALFQLADTIEKRTATARQRVEKMTQAILAKAFRGELVPTEAELARQEGRDYEPASVLLERIRTERARAQSAAPVKERRRK